MTEPVFTIIIPTFNSDKVIGAALNSILSQSFGSFEILLMDNKSTDNTISIVNEMYDKRITVISESDKGIYDAMNKGIAKARGEWLFFLGSDDTLYDINVLAAVHEAISDQVDVLYGNVFYMKTQSIYDGPFDASKLLSKNICHQSVFYRKRVFEKLGLFDLRYRSHADYEHNFRWFFSPKIRKKFVNLTIANFTFGGFSSTNKDVAFLEDKHLKFLTYAGRSLSLKTRLKILWADLKKAVKTGDLRRSWRRICFLPRVFVPSVPKI